MIHSIGIILLVYGISVVSIYWILHMETTYNSTYELYKKSEFKDFMSFDSFLRVIVYCPILNTLDLMVFTISFIFSGIVYLIKKKK